VRGLRRGVAPRVLVDNAERWTKDYRDSGSARPDSRRYAHKDVRRALEDMSAQKCLYCERALKPREGGSDAEVEHRRGVRPHELGYLWSNLCLSCKGCNSAKKARPEIAIEDTLDPCDEAVDPMDHLDAHHEYAFALRGSLQGAATIKKLGLNTQIELLLTRGRCLGEYWRRRGDRIAEAAKSSALSEEDVVAIERSLAEEFARAEMPFSWMFRALLRLPGALSRR
jgi:hypothetical protein